MRLAVAGATALLLQGCVATMAPRYARPAAPVPAALPAGGAYPPAAAAATPAADLAWRDFMVDPKLRSVVELSLANNRDLRVAVLNAAAARAQFQVQRSALAPQVGANFNPTFEHLPASVLGAQAGATGAGVTSSSQSVTIQYYEATLGVSSYELDLWGRVRSLTKTAFEQYLANDEARRAAQISLISEVATAYLTYAADLDRLNTAKDTLKSDNESLDITRTRFKGGVATELDVRQAQTAADQARSDVASYTTQVAQDVNALTLLVGAQVPADLLPDGLGQSLPTLADVPAGLSSDVLLNRPDVLQAEHQLKANNANIGAARAAFFPTILLTGGGGSASLGLSSLFGSGTGAWTFTPTVSLPIFDAGKNRANLRLAKVQRETTVAQYEKSVQTAFREVADALARRGTIDEQLAAQEDLVDASSRSLGLSQLRYQRGTDTYLNTLTAEVSLYSARQNLIATRLARAMNLVTLYQTLGGGTH
jgi:multidrug efflux system outer membrane protein